MVTYYQARELFLHLARLDNLDFNMSQLWSVKALCLLEFSQALPPGTHSGRGLTLVLHPLFPPNIDKMERFFFKSHKSLPPLLNSSLITMAKSINKTYHVYRLFVA